jgi:RTX calcium-binding nonapeptide repeat (4 copies)
MRKGMNAAARLRRRLWLVGPAFALSIAGMGAAAATAGAYTAAPLWQCRASVAPIVINGTNRVELLLANGNPAPAPGQSLDRPQCVNDDAGPEDLAGALGLPTDFISAKTAVAMTRIDPPLGLAIDQKVASTARVEDLAIQLPPGSGVTLGVNLIESHAAGSCVNGKPSLSGSSQAVGLTLGGKPVSLDDALTQIAEALKPLNQIIEIKLNEQLKDATSLTQRAMHIKLLTPDKTPLVDVVLGETKSGFNGEVCNPDKQVPGPPNVRPCPSGSTFDAGSGMCIIDRNGVLGYQANGTDVVVGRPFDGPSGGTVITLDEARKKYPNSPCVKGAGPAYAIIGTNKADHITGTNKDDRILALGGNDAVDGGRGNDCIDGGSGDDSLSGGLGNDRIYGGTGNDHLNGGSGNDMLDGGAGNDTLNAGFGADRLYGGPGRDYLNIATAGRPAFADCGTGRDKVRANYNERNRTRGCEVRYFLRDRPSLKQ